MPVALLLVGAVALAAKANARWPTRLRFVREPSFFFSWVVIELAAWWLVLEGTAFAGLAGAGALRGLAGWAGPAPIGVSCAARAGPSRGPARTSPTAPPAGAPPAAP